ncbi:MAG: right-handed parallel beta-helix repeat-containing protein, partial [Pseudomonadota bacterium]
MSTMNHCFWNPAILIFLIMCTLFVPRAEATDYYVTIDSGIQGCIDSDAVIDGDTIILPSGTYYERIDFKGKAITVRSENPDDPSVVAATVLSGTGGSIVTFGSGEGRDSVLIGITIHGGSAGKGGAVFCSGSSPTVKNCMIIDNEATTAGGAVYCETGSSAVIWNCDILANSAGTDAVTGTGGGIACCQSTPVIVNCVIAGNDADAGGGLWSDAGSSPRMVNCTVSGNAAGGISCDGPDSLVQNCIIWGNDPGQVSGLAQLSCCNTAQDPLFVNESVGNYHLMPCSPCINRGDNAALDALADPPLSMSVTGDRDGNSRIVAGKVDIGAFEYSATVVTIEPSDPIGAEPFRGPVDKASFLVRRTGDLTLPLRVDYTAGGTATPDADYLKLPGLVVIPARQTQALITVTPLHDSDYEGPADEEVTVQLVCYGPYGVGSPDGAKVVIKDNDLPPPPPPTVTIEAIDPTGTEPFRGPVDRGAFLVKRTGDISTAITVNYSVGAESTATSAVDYQALSGSVVIPARRADALIYVVPLNDTTDEPDETVIVTLGTGTGYNLGTDLTATVTIIDNDEPPPPEPTVTIEASDPTGTEPFRGPVDRGAFLVKRTGDISTAITVNYSVG